ncbi:MAG TPA: hypothetical protein VF173_24645 [Thermoanaerobaculia bacterium]|nr:hypothetical protein [Thermoanaerobaculia bacterium]
MFAAQSEVWGLYLEALRLHAHQLLVWAHSDVRFRLHPDLDEPSITGLLGDAMKARLNCHPDTPAEYDHYTIADQDPISPSGQLGNDRLRLDLCVIRSGIRPRLAYIFEAKRLRAGGFPIGKYAGDRGIGDFIECRYGAGSPEAVMIGLFQNKDAAYWLGELNRIFDEDCTNSHPRLEIVDNLTPVRIHDGLPNELQSRHRRRDSSQIRLFHIFLDCTLNDVGAAHPSHTGMEPGRLSG